MNISQKLKNSIFSLALVSSLLVPSLLFSLPIGAQIPPGAKGEACRAIGGAVTQDCNVDGNGGTAGDSVSGLVSTAINILSWIVGIVAVIMIIISGFKFITSNGDSNGVASARNTLIYSLVGVVVALLAQLMVNFVIGKV